MVQFDELPGLLDVQEPILRLADWFEKRILGRTFNEAAQSGQPAYVFLDEVQNLDDWAPQLKFLVDSSDARVMVTGSSALRIAQGRDSLAGRISTLEMGPLFLREILEIRGEGTLEAPLPFSGLAPLKDKDFWLKLKRLGQEHQRQRDRAFAVFLRAGGISDRPREAGRILGGTGGPIDGDSHSPGHST
jgi:predicted AAA+ superfamily ATPase